MVHMGIGNIAGIPELMIDKGEGDMLASASANLLAQFDIAPDPKTQAIIGLLLACGAVYGPRVVVYRQRKYQEEKAARENKGVVFDANGFATGTTSFTE